jgi:CHASE3 domain sensor protein
MGQNLRFDDQQSMASLVGEILHDSQKLIRQEISLVRAELQEEWQTVQASAYVLAGGLLLVGVGVLLLALTLVHGIEGWTSLPIWPVTES